MRTRFFKDSVICFFIVAALVFASLQPAEASSQDPVTWNLDGGVLTISGTGAMEDYSNAQKAPWYSMRAEVQTLVVEEGVTAIGKNAFWGCSAMSEVSLPATLRKIGSGAFFQCAGLTEITVPAGVTILEQGVFGQCEELSTVTLHDGITDIEKDAFSRCYSLRHITLPAEMETIGEHAFFGCVQLQQLTFPQTLAMIETAAFYGCGNLTALRFMGNAPAFSNQALLGISAAVFYNKNDSSWDTVVAQTYGGTVVWVGECFHQYTMTFTPPTCEQEGYSTYSCDLCGDRYDDLYIPAFGHMPNDPVREGNERVIYCETCGTELSRELVILYIPGDINGDGAVNNKDATRLFQYMTGWRVEVVEAALDVNGDGKVNNKDATRLFQYLSGWPVEIY